MLLPLCVCEESVRLSIWRSCVRSTLLCIFLAKAHTEYMMLCLRSTMLLLFILGACSLPDIQFVVSAKVTSGYTHAMSDRWWSMTTASKRNKYARDNLRLNISAEDVIVWIDFLIKSLHFRMTRFLWSNYWRFVWSLRDRKITWKLSNGFMNPYSIWSSSVF